MPTGDNHQALTSTRLLAAAVRLDSKVIPERPAQKKIVPGADVENGNSDLREMVFDGYLLPIVVEAWVGQPIEEIRRESLGAVNGVAGVAHTQQRESR